MLSSKSFNAVFYLMFFGMFMGLCLIGGIFALIVHLVGGPLWLLITVWALPPGVGTLLFLGLGRRLTKFLKD